MSRHHGKHHGRRHDKPHYPDRKPRDEAPSADDAARAQLKETMAQERAIKLAHLEQWEENSLKNGYNGAPVMIAPAGTESISKRMNEVIPFYGVFVTRSDAFQLAYSFGFPEGITKALEGDVQVLMIEPDNYNHAEFELHSLIQMLNDEVKVSHF